MYEQLVVTTKSDMRLVDINNGKTVQIMANLMQSEEEITVAKLYLNHKKVLIANNKGALKTHYLPNGQFYSNNFGHAQEVTQIFVDYANKLVLSTAWDSSIILQ
mmetsp:Transcript_6882/g.5119  ORF Transcript_6882/g.5119 Transcript_6882/m.5119 type:complete len:104 (-) Transcript_6882:2123-2434(-)